MSEPNRRTVLRNFSPKRCVRRFDRSADRGREDATRIRIHKGIHR